MAVRSGPVLVRLVGMGSAGAVSKTPKPAETAPKSP
jgi:hypothetical protein